MIKALELPATLGGIVSKKMFGCLAWLKDGRMFAIQTPDGRAFRDQDLEPLKLAIGALGQKHRSGLIYRSDPTTSTPHENTVTLGRRSQTTDSRKLFDPPTPHGLSQGIYNFRAAQ